MSFLMRIPPISIEMAIIIALVLGGLIGAAAGRHRLKMIVMSTYIGIVLVGYLATPASKFAHTSFEIAAWTILGAPILLFGLLGSHPGHARHRGHKAEHKGPLILNLLVGLAAGALVIASAFQVLPARDQSDIYGNSFLASELNIYFPWLVCILPVFILVQGIFRQKDDKH